MDPDKKAFVMERKVRLDQMDRSFDVEYWQRLGPEAIFEAAWDLLVQASHAEELNSAPHCVRPVQPNYD